MPNNRGTTGALERYTGTVETLNTTGQAASVDVETTYFDVDGTDAFTCPAPKRAKQTKRFVQNSGANTPAGTLTVTGMKIATQNVFSGFDRTTAQLDAAPRTLVLYSPTGVYWDIESAVGVTVA